jgi:uracil-DNA glycosylase
LTITCGASQKTRMKIISGDE